MKANDPLHQPARMFSISFVLLVLIIAAVLYLISYNPLPTIQGKVTGFIEHHEVRKMLDIGSGLQNTGVICKHPISHSPMYWCGDRKCPGEIEKIRLMSSSEYSQQCATDLVNPVCKCKGTLKTTTIANGSISITREPICFPYDANCAFQLGREIGIEISD